jgi:adenylate cyclase
MQEDDETTVTTLEAYRVVFREKVKAHHGRIVDMAGDSVLAVFEAATEAVRAAVAIQSELAERNMALAEALQMQFRIGINLGEIIERPDGTVYGDGVNIASRLESISEPKGVTVSGTVFDQVKNRVQLNFDFIGEQSVKNITEPVKAYRVVAEGMAVSALTLPKRERAISNLVAIAAAAAAVVVIAAVGIYSYRPAAPQLTATAGPPAKLSLPDKPSIAVLPFANMSDDPAQEYFADGITEEIITSLSKLQGLFVIARNSTFQYKGKAIDVRHVGRELGVRYVLEGSVRKSDDRLRITTQLVNTSDGEHVWAERYDRRLQDVFAVQDEITRRIVEELDVKLVFGEQARAWRRTTANVEAYELYLKGTALNLNPTKENLYLARRYYEDATERDPKFAAAYSHLAYSHMLNVLLGYTDSPALEIERGFKAARRAIALDGSQGPAYTALGRLHMQNDELDKALTYGKRGVELGPNSAIALSVYAHMLEAAGKPKECLSYLRLAMRLGPYAEPWWPWMEGLCLLQLGRAEEAIAAIKRAIELYGPDMVFARVFLVHAYVAAGRDSDARAEAQAVLRLDPSFSVDAFLKGFHFYKDPAIVTGYATNLRKAGLK